MEGSSSASGAKPAGSSRTMLIAIIIVVIVIVAAVAAVLLTNNDNPTPEPTNYLEKGFKMQIYYNSGNTARQAAAEILKTKLESLNPGKILITVTGIEWAQYLKLQRGSNMPAFFLGWAPDYADPNDYVVPFLASQGTYLHTIGYSNATLDAMITTAGSNPDPVTRDQQYKQITLDVQKECLYVWVSQAAVLYVSQSGISGYHFNPLYSNLYYYDLNKTGGTPGNPTDTFTYGEIAGNPDYFDPARDYETAGGEVLQNVYETLIWYQSDRSDVLIPQLCTELPSVANGGITNSDKDYTYHVRPGVTFQDGSALDAYDVKFSIERLLRLNDVNGPAWMYGETLIPDYYNSQYAPSHYVGSIDNYTTPFEFNNATGVMTGGIQNASALKGAMWVKDPMTIQFNLTIANPAWNSILAFNGGSVVSLKNVFAHLSASNINVFSKEAYDWVNGHPVGTGPYEFIQFAPSQYVSMKRYDNYWRGPADIKNVLLQQIADTTSRINQLIAGDLDAAAVPRASQQAVFGKGLNIVNSSNWNVNFLGLNQDIDITGRNQDLNDIPSDFFADLRVRQAFAHAWDFQTFNVTTMRGVAIQPNGVIPKGMFGYHADIPQYAFNLTQAAALLKSVTVPTSSSTARISVEFVARID